MSYLQQINGIMALGFSLADACKGMGITEEVYRRWVKDAESRATRKSEREQESASN